MDIEALDHVGLPVADIDRPQDEMQRLSSLLAGAELGPECAGSENTGAPVARRPAVSATPGKAELVAFRIAQHEMVIVFGHHACPELC
jgi:hypothetical protein